MQTPNTERKRFLESITFPTLFLALLWLIKGFEIYFHIDLSPYSLYPKHISGLPGILTMPLLHADIGHIAANSIPFWVLGTAIFYFYKEIAWRVIVITYLMCGLWTWIIGRSEDDFGFAVHHLGASGLIYGWAFFLFFSGVFRRSVQLSAISFLVIFLYGSIVWGLLPLQKAISYEGHISGALSGLLCAFFYRKEGPQRVKYKWEDEEDGDEPENNNNEAYWMTGANPQPPAQAEEEEEEERLKPPPEPNQTLHINYYFKKEGPGEGN